MRIFGRHAASRQPLDGAATGEDFERSMMEAVSRGSREAFVVLFDRTAATVGAGLTTRLGDPNKRTAILAATYVEVWWLAGCRSGAESDVSEWIRRILDRRVADADRATAQQADGEPRPGYAERELACLLDRPVERLWPG